MNGRKENKNAVIIITGERGSGKTTLCILLSKKFKEKGLQVKGVVSPGFFIKERKVKIMAHNLDTHDEKVLAKFDPGWDEAYPKREWRLNPAGLSWGNEVINQSIPTDILIIDELGFMEFEKGIGWISSFRIINEGSYRAAFIVIRPGLIQDAKEKMSVDKIITLENLDNLEIIAAEIIDQLLIRFDR